MIRQTLRSLRGALLPAAAALVTAAACAPDNALAPSGDSSPRTALHLLPTEASTVVETAVAPARLAQCIRREALSETGVFGPSGGRLVLGNNQLIIPPGALLRETRITASVPADTIAAIRLEPAGLTFRKPAGLILDVAGCNVPSGAVPDIVYLNDSGTVLEWIEAVFTTLWRTTAAPIDHFSQYAVAV